jgi:lipopolysaccharide biosynthesis glycosyltransferase
LQEHAPRPLHLWVVGARPTAAVVRGLAERFPQITLSWVPAVAHALLLLADLLPDVDRLVVLPLPSVVTGDVAELAGLDLGGHALAAATYPGRTGVSGFGVIHAAAARLGRRTEAAAALRRTAHARHAFDFQAFGADVLVLDAARLRAERLSDQALRLVEEYELDDVEALHYLVGPDRAEVPARWAVVPSRTPERGPGLIHWPDRIKPWQQILAPERERWRTYA